MTILYSNSCCSCSFEPEIIKIGQSSHKLYINNILNFQESTTIFNARTKIVRKLIEGTTYVSPSVREDDKVEGFYKELVGLLTINPCIKFSL